MIETLENRRLLAANLLVDGDFEHPSIGNGESGSDYTDYGKNRVLASAWKITAGAVEIISNDSGYSLASDPASGSQYLNLAGTSRSAPASMTQSVATVAGQQYRLRFAYTATPFVLRDGDNQDRKMTVSENSIVLSTLSKNVFDGSPNNPDWTYVGYDFTATSATTAINFKSLTSGTDGMAIDNVSLASQSSGAAVDLSDSVAVAVPSPSQIKPGKKVTVATEIFSNAAAVALSPVQIDLSLSTNADGTSPVFQQSVTRLVRLRAGGHATFKVAELLPVDLVPGNYYWTATVDSANTLNESDLTNNSATTSSPLIVNSRYPNLLGTFSGMAVDKRGPDKAGPFSEMALVQTEDAVTGAFTETLISSEAGLAVSPIITGTISTSGVYVGDAPDIGAHFTAKLTGNVLRGSYLRTNGDYVQFTLTRAI